MKDKLLIYSGGLDSTTMLYEYLEEIALAVAFNYGSNHNSRELHFARENCRRLGVELVEIDLNFIGQHFKSSLLEGADAIPEGDYADDNMRSTVVPFRNGIMLAIAAGVAESRGLSAVMIANHGGDHAIYPDCRRGFVDAMSKAVSEGTYEGLTVVAPYTDLTKPEIVGRGANLGVDYALTYSCYRGSEAHCGVCGTCRERRAAFAAVGIADPTKYEK